MARVVLKKRKAQALQRRHPWVFSGAIHQIEGAVADGDTVTVHNADGDFLAMGHYHDGSIAVRILSFEENQAHQDFWNTKIQNAYRFRQRLGLIDNLTTNCYRLIHAEGDGLPGLIIDLYDHHAVIQCHSIGMHRNREQIAQALQFVYQDRLETIYDKSKEVLPRNYASGIENSFLLGNTPASLVLENGYQFAVNWVEGQKTGFFIDQRENRQLLHTYAQDRVVLNAFCYSGGFSVYALGGNAREVDSVDISATAIDLAEANISLNAPQGATYSSHVSDVLTYLKSSSKPYDVMVVDPPAYAKSLKKRHNAVQGYKRLNAMALRKIASGGILFTFSCSQVIDAPLFYNTIVAAAIEARRKVRLMHRLSQAPDHPVNIYHPEGAYLKGLVLYVE